MSYSFLNGDVTDLVEDFCCVTYPLILCETLVCFFVVEVSMYSYIDLFAVFNDVGP